MCKALEELMEDKWMEGKRIGEKRGTEKERILIIKKMLQEGMDQKLIKRITECSEAELMAAAEK